MSMPNSHQSREKLYRKGKQNGQRFLFFFGSNPVNSIPFPPNLPHLSLSLSSRCVSGKACPCKLTGRGLEQNKTIEKKASGLFLQFPVPNYTHISRTRLSVCYLRPFYYPPSKSSIFYIEDRPRQRYS